LFPGIDNAVPKTFVLGTHRSVAPAATLARLQPLLAPLGITRLANVTGLDVIGIPVVVACRPNSRSLAVAQGKGLDLDAAKASALMETIELWHAERIALPLKLASFDELRFAHRMIDVGGLPRLSTRGFDGRLTTLWIEGFDLQQGAHVWLPYELVHMNYTLPLPPGSGSFVMSSNGLASGNHLLEALCHGICEVVERDADSVWAARSDEARAATRLDLSSVDDPVCRGLLERYREAGVAVAVWETTSDVGVAAFRCTILDAHPDPTRLLYANSGMGCHPARAIALGRALTEAAQARLTTISSSRDDVTRHDYEISRNPEMLARIRARLLDDTGERRFGDAPDFLGETFDDDLRWLLERLAAAGCDSVVGVDLTHSGLDVPVARVVIPGLEPSTLVPGYVPGPRAQAAAE
jgi:ribosomal protein S12 methylthiotransferase accessory factor